MESSARKKLRIWLLICTSTLFILLIGFLVWHYLGNENSYFVILEGGSMIRENEPVIAENTVIGKVSKIETIVNDADKLLLTLLMEKSINIPDKSYVILNKGNSGTIPELTVKLISSQGFYQRNDTLPVMKAKVIPEKREEVAEPIKPDTAIVRADHKVQEDVRKKAEDSASEIGFHVQILSSNKEIPENSQKFKEIRDVEVYEENGLYKYYVGSNMTLDQAVKYCEQIKKSGFSDAFVIALKGKQRITVKRAQQLLKK